MNFQFDRFAEVEIRDFNGNLKTTIGNEFEIEFDYYKTIDQTQEDDSGKIRIFGLTPERVKTLQVDGGEVHFRCGYRGSSIKTLFIAYISRLYYNSTDNTTVTTIECSANLLSHYVIGSIESQNMGKLPLGETLYRLAKQLNADDIRFLYPEAPESSKDDIKEFIQTFAINQSAVGDLNYLLVSIASAVGFIVKKDMSEGSNLITFTLEGAALQKVLRVISSGYSKISLKDIESNKSNIFHDTLSTSQEDFSITMLDYSTGLIESKTEYKIAKAYLDQGLTSSEEETFLSQQKRASDAEKAGERARKEEERERKAIESGKEYKPKKVSLKRTTIKVNRRYNRVKALLNPSVKPQSMVAIEADRVLEIDEITDADKEVTSIQEDSTVIIEYKKYRVRSATYKGNNKRNEWVMDLYCEDTTTTNVTEDELNSFLSTVSSEDVEFEGIEDVDNLFQEE